LSTSFKSALRRALGVAGPLLLLVLLLTACGGPKYDVDPALELGTAQEIQTDKSGIVYTVTDQNYAVVFALPDRESVDLTGFAPEQEAVYLADTALQKAKKLTTLTFDQNTAFAPVLLQKLEALPSFSYPQDTLADDWVFTVKRANLINQERDTAGLENIQPDLTLCRAARLRAAALEGAPKLSINPSVKDTRAALSELGRSYPFVDNWFDCYDAREGVDAASGAISVHYGYSDGVVYDRMGLCVHQGNYETPGQWAYFAAYAATQSTGYTQDGLLYARMEDGVHIVGCRKDAVNVKLPLSVGDIEVTGVEDGIFYDHKKLLSAVIQTGLQNNLSDDLFLGCDNLRAIAVTRYWKLTDKGYEPFGGWLPEDCEIFEVGSQLVEQQKRPWLYYLWVEDDAVYANDYPGEPCVLLSVPRNVAEFAVPEQVNGQTVAHIHRSALDGADSLTKLTIPADCVPDSTLLTRLVGEGKVELSYDVNSMTTSMLYTIMLAQQINAARDQAGLPHIHPSPSLVRGARARAAEIPQLTKEQRTEGLRPDGRKYYTVLTDPLPYTDGSSVKWVGLQESYQGVRDLNGLSKNVLPQFAERFSDVGGPHLRTLLGGGLYYGDYQGSDAFIGSCLVGNVEGYDPN